MTTREKVVWEEDVKEGDLPKEIPEVKTVEEPLPEPVPA